MGWLTVLRTLGRNLLAVAVKSLTTFFQNMLFVEIPEVSEQAHSDFGEGELLRHQWEKKTEASLSHCHPGREFSGGPWA